MTALTIYGSANPASTLAAAGDLWAATGGTSGNTSTKVGTTTLFKQVFSLGTTTNQSGVASIPAPTDAGWHGWMWDVTTLEGQRIAAGTWTPTIHLLASTGTTIVPTLQWYKRSSAGAYTSIGAVTGSSIALTTSAQLLVFTPPSLALMDFATGDKLCVWLWVNQSAGGATNSTISVVEGTSSSVAGVASETQTVTPGYAPTPITLPSVTMDGVGVLTGTLTTTSLVALSATLAGAGTLSETLLATAPLTDTLIGAGTLSGTLVLSTQLSAECDGIGVLASTLSAVTPLTVYTLTAQDPTITTATKLGTALGGTQAGTATTFIGTGTGYGEVYSRGSGAAWPAFGSVQSPNGHGYMLDTPMLEGQTIPAGNWTPAFRITLGGSATTATSDLIIAAYTYNVTSFAYTSIGTCTLSGQALTNAANFTWAATSLGAVSFGIDDRLYFETWQNITVGSNSGTGTTRWVQSSNPTLGVANCSIITPGYVQTPGFLAATIPGVGTLTSTLTLTTALTASTAGNGTLAGTLSTSGGGVSLSITLNGVATLAPTLSVNTAFSVTLAGVGTLSSTFSLVISYVIIASDTFVRANQSAWGTASGGQTWAAVRNVAVWSIASNEGLLGANSGGTFTITRLGSVTTTDQEILTRVKPGNTTSNIGIVARFVDINNFYYGVMVGGTVVIGKDVGGVFSTIASTSFSYSTSNFYQMRLRADGSTLQLKIWQDGTSEPSAWSVSTTDGALASGGFGTATDAILASSFDSLTVSNGVQALTGECDGIGTLVATMSTPTALSATLVGTGTLTSTLALSTALSTSLAGVGQLSGTLSANTALADTFTGAGTLSGTLSTSSSGVALSTTCTGIGTLSETLSATTSLASIIAGIGTLTGTSSLSTALSVTFVGIGTLTETLSAKTALTDTCTGTGTLTGTLALSTALSATLSGIGTSTEALTATTSLATSIAGIGAFSGTPSLSIAISTTFAGVGTLSGALRAGFFTRSAGGALLAPNGDTFRFAGANIPWLGVIEAGTRYPTPFEIDDALRTAVEMGITVIRSHTMGISVGSSYSIEPSLGIWNDAAFAPIDYALYRGAQLGLRFIIPLTDSNNYYPGWMGTFTAWEGQLTSTFYTNAAVIADFEAYINHLLNHVNVYNGLALKDDPTVLMWETGNELNANGGANTTWIGWTTTIASYIKSVAPNALVMDGFHGTAANTLSAHTDRLANIHTDASTTHYYGSPVSTYSPAMTGDAAACATAGKIYIIGEYDWTSASDTLANTTAWQTTMESTTALSGDMFWTLYAHNGTVAFNTHNDGFSLYYPGNDADVSSGTQMLERSQQIRNHAYAIAGIASLKPAAIIPAAPLFTQVSISGADTLISWRGVVGAQLYKLERSPTGTSSWTTISSTLVDNQGVYTDTAQTGNWYRVAGINVDGVAGAPSEIILATVAVSKTFSGTGTLSGTLAAKMALTGTINGVGQLSGTASLTTAFGTTLAGTSILSATLSATVGLADTLAGAGTLTGTPGYSAALTRTLSGQGVLTTSLQAGNTVALSPVTLAGVGSATFTLQATTTLSMTLAGNSTLTAAALQERTVLSTTLTGIGTCAGTLQASVTLAAALAGGGVLTSALQESTVLTATLPGTSALSGAIQERTALSATLAGSSSVSGTLAGQVQITSSIQSVGTAAFTLFASTSCTVTLTGTSTLTTATLSYRVALALSILAFGQLSGSVTVPSLSFLTATWKTRDGNMTWSTRDGAVAWETRDEFVTWETRG